MWSKQKKPTLCTKPYLLKWETATNIKISSRLGCPWWHTFLTLSEGKECTGRPPRIQLLVVFHTQGDALLHSREKAMPFS